jgi:hypothetical protein
MTHLKVFLTLFPNFIILFNDLLRKEDQIGTKKERSLMPCFEYLHLCVQVLTIWKPLQKYSTAVLVRYTHKIRVKSKSPIPADDFEKTIMEIKFIVIFN